MTDLDPKLVSYGTGSITGFNRFVTADGDIDPVLTGWSIDQLMAYLRDPKFIPSRDWIIALENDMIEHLEDFNNPHQTTVDQVASDFVSQILSSITPGTVPDIGPFYSFKADVELPLGDFFPASVNFSNIYRLKSNGIFKPSSSDPSYVGTDYSAGLGAIPMYASFTNYVSDEWNEDTNSSVNTLITESVITPDFLPGRAYRISETSTTGIFGVRIAADLSSSVSYTVAMFVASAGIEGSLKIGQPDDPTKFAILSLDTGEHVVSDPSVQISTTMYKNGVIKVSYSFTTLPLTLGSVVVAFYEASGTISGRVGIYGRDIFLISTPLITTAPPQFPIPFNKTLPALSDSFVIDTSRFIDYPTTARFTTSLDVVMDVLTVPILGTNIYILRMDPFYITRTETLIELRVDGIILYYCPIVQGLNRISVSYTSDEIVFKHMNNDSVIIPGPFPPIPTTNWSLGPFGGYLASHEYYATSDTNRLLEFLNNA